MTRRELLERALNVIANGTSKYAFATQWLNDGLDDLERSGIWGWLRQRGVLTLTASDYDISFTEAKWGSAGTSALSDYSKDLMLFNSAGKPLDRFINSPGINARTEFQRTKALVRTAATPTHFLCEDGSGEVLVDPVPPATPGTLLYSCVRTVPYPTQDDLGSVFIGSDNFYYACYSPITSIVAATHKPITGTNWQSFFKRTLTVGSAWPADATAATASGDLTVVCNLPQKMQSALVNYIKYRLYDSVGQTEKSAMEFQIWDNLKKSMIMEEASGFGGLLNQQQGNQ